MGKINAQQPTCYGTIVLGHGVVIITLMPEDNGHWEMMITQLSRGKMGMGHNRCRHAEAWWAC